MSDQNKFKNFDYAQFWKSGLEPKLGLYFISLDARVLYFILPLLFVRNVFTYSALILAILFFLYLSLNSLSYDFAKARIRAWIAGKNRYVSNKRLKVRRFTNGK